MVRLLLLIIAGVIVASLSQFFVERQHIQIPQMTTSFWEIQSIDTMKYSRDLAQEKLGDASFDSTIEEQITRIRNTGATHVAIGTPYDEEFVPFMKRWVAVARKNNLKVWYRGNLSGWEGWFKYPKITRGEHTERIVNFIYSNKDLFEDGDIFTSCTECENGGPGDPRFNGDVEGHRSFLIQEYALVKKAFNAIDKQVIANYYSMNGDVARLVMNKATTSALDGIVAIDHYVASPDSLALDIREIAGESGGRVVLSEFGAPVPDIHGEMTQDEQAAWLDRALVQLSEIESLVGLNYWVSVGGSTELWNEVGVAQKAVEVLHRYYEPPVLRGVVENAFGEPVGGATVRLGKHVRTTDESGTFAIPFVVSGAEAEVVVSAQGVKAKLYKVKDNMNVVVFILDDISPGAFTKIQNYIKDIFLK